MREKHKTLIRWVMGLNAIILTGYLVWNYTHVASIENIIFGTASMTLATFALFSTQTLGEKIFKYKKNTVTTFCLDCMTGLILVYILYCAKFNADTFSLSVSSSTFLLVALSLMELGFANQVASESKTTKKQVIITIFWIIFIIWIVVYPLI